MVSHTDELRIVVVGRTGSGISSTANAILKDKHFVSKVSMKSVTTVSEKGKLVEDGQKMIVVNTPGMFNTKISNAEVKAQLKKSIEMVAPGPHLFLYVFQLGRQTDEEEETIKEIIDIFGNSFLKQTIIVFTGIENLGDTPIKHYIEEMPDFVKYLLERCNYRYVTFKTPNNDQINKMSLPTICEFQNDEYFSKDMLIQSNMRRNMEAVKYVFGRMCYSATEKLKSVPNRFKNISFLTPILCCSTVAFIITIALLRLSLLYSDEKWNVVLLRSGIFFFY